MERFDDCSIRLREDGLKFSAALPKRLAAATLAARLADLDRAAAVLVEPTRFVVT